MKPKQIALLLALVFLSHTGCGVYTFSQSTLPGYLKTIDIPLFENQSTRPDVAENLTSALTREVIGASGTNLRLVQGRGDASINGTVISYIHEEYDYDVTRVREAEINEFIVRITVDVSFTDNKKSEAIYKGTIRGEGPYEARTQTEEDGLRAAVDDVIDQIIQNSIEGW